jgi:hypothetical protein
MVKLKYLVSNIIQFFGVISKLWFVNKISHTNFKSFLFPEIFKQRQTFPVIYLFKFNIPKSWDVTDYHP